MFVKRIFSLIMLLTGLISNQVTNCTFLSAEKNEVLQEDELFNTNWTSFAYSGYTWSKNAGIVNPDPSVFTSVAPGDSDDSTVSNCPFSGTSLVRNLNDWCVIGMSYEVYGLFTYQRYHSNGIAAISPQREVVGVNYVRSFSLSHQSVMAETYLKLPKKWKTTLGTTNIRPILGGGVGIGITNFFDFQTLGYDAFTTDTKITTLGSNNISKNFAWRVECGINFKTADSRTSFGLSYRYYYGGKFSSGNRYQFNDVHSQGGVLIFPPWTGAIRANQIKLYISVEFN